MKKRQTSKHVIPFQKVAKRPGEAVMLKQVENIVNIETSNETSKISCDLKEREQSMVQGWSTTDNLLESGGVEAGSGHIHGGGAEIS